MDDIDHFVNSYTKFDQVITILLNVYFQMQYYFRYRQLQQTNLFQLLVLYNNWMYIKAIRGKLRALVIKPNPFISLQKNICMHVQMNKKIIM